MNNRSLPGVVALHDIRDVEKFCRSALNQLPSGMFLQADEYEDELQECFERLYKIAQRYDAARTPSFEQFARYQLVEFYIRGDLPRKLLGRTGARIAERSHAELDERADAGHLPWQPFAPEQDDLRTVGAGVGPRPEAGRNRTIARSRAVLGLRPRS